MQNYKGFNMNITSAKYTEDNMTGEKGYINIVVDGVVMFVPLDTANRDYQAILEWVAEGNTIAEAD